LQFDQLNGRSDGGAILLKAADHRYALAGCLRDKREAGNARTIEAGDGRPFQLLSYRPDSDAEMGRGWPELVANGDC
jgi:hypothetical protein